MNTAPTNPRTTIPDGPYGDDPGDEFLLEEIVRELGDTLPGEVTTGRDWIESVELPRVGDTLVLRLANGQVVILTAVLSEGDPCDWCGKDIGDPNTASPLIGPANNALGRAGGEQGVYCSNECLERVCRSAGWHTSITDPYDRAAAERGVELPPTCDECGGLWDREHECGVDPAVTGAITDAMLADANALADALIERLATVPHGGVVTPSEADEVPVVGLTWSEADLARRAVQFLIEELEETGAHEDEDNYWHDVSISELVSLRGRLAGA